ncbi:MAG: mannose-6-phosphate isomerase, partial [Verrucomicrobia bacterium]
MNELLRLAPLYHERVWGGRVLASRLGRVLPGTAPIGEAWEIVDRPEAQSVVRVGRHSGKTLRQVIAAHPLEVMGPGWDAKRPFPILVKWLDCRERLSLQVHPPAHLAGAVKGQPKTEVWYIADTQSGAGLIVGLKNGVTRERFEAALSANALEPLVHHFNVTAGDSILVRSGQLHAIDAGNLILEIQQNSDTTYRVYDWGRSGLDGKPRELHVQQALASIKWNDFEPAPVRAAPTSGVIAKCPEFRIRRVVLDAGASISFAAGEQAHILSVVTGELSGVGKLPIVRGENVVLPYSGA